MLYLPLNTILPPPLGTFLPRYLFCLFPRGTYIDIYLCTYIDTYIDIYIGTYIDTYLGREEKLELKNVDSLLSIQIWNLLSPPRPCTLFLRHHRSSLALSEINVEEIEARFALAICKAGSNVFISSVQLI